MAARHSGNPEEQLIVYGSLAPGGLYHFLLADLPGTWERCVIRGRMGQYGGFKALHYDAAGPEHPAWLFASTELSPENFRNWTTSKGRHTSASLFPSG